MLPPSVSDAPLVDQLVALVHSVPAHIRALPQTVPQFFLGLLTGPPADFFIWILLPILLFSAFRGRNNELKRLEMEDSNAKAEQGKKDATATDGSGSRAPAASVGGGGAFVSDKGHDGKGAGRGNQPVKRAEEAKVRKNKM